MKKIVSIGVSLLLVASLSGCQNMTKQDVGVLSGAALGGLVGSRFGGGQGQILASVAGAVVGGLVGGTIGRSMDKSDQNQMQSALENTKTGQTKKWQNPDSSTDYATTPVKTFKKPSGAYCREYVTKATIAGKTQQVYGSACRQPDGTWKEVSKS